MSFFNFSLANLMSHWGLFLRCNTHIKGNLHLLPKSVIIICKIPFSYFKRYLHLCWTSSLWK